MARAAARSTACWCQAITVCDSEFRFAGEGIEIAATVTRKNFETWIASDVARLAATLDEALRNARVAPQDIDRIFLTGGTSFVPAVQRIFVDRFGAERITSADQFESIALGLALIGRASDPEQWSVSG